MLLGAIGKRKAALFEMPNQVVSRHPGRSVRGGRRRGDVQRVAPIGPDEIVRTGSVGTWTQANDTPLVFHSSISKGSGVRPSASVKRKSPPVGEANSL